MSIKFLRKLDSSQIYNAQNMTHELWSEGLSLETRLDKLQAQLDFSQGKVLCMSGFVDDQGDLVCSMKRYSLNLMYQNQVIPTVGFGAVFTPEKFRGKGYAKQMIQTVLEDASQSGMEAAILFSDIDPSYYKALDFVEFDAVNMTVETEHLPSAPVSLEYRRADIEDLPSLLSFFQNIFPSDCVHYRRDADLWNFFRLRNGPVTDYILSQDGRDIGYLCVSEGEKFYLNEFFVPADKEEAFLIFLRSLAERAGAKKIYGCKNFQKLESIPKTLETRDKAIPMLLSLRPGLHFENAWFGFMDQF